MTGAEPPRVVASRVLHELGQLDQAVYAAVAATPTPTVDAALGRISNAANDSRLWLATAGGLSLLGRKPRRAALAGVTAIGLTSALVNLGVKPVLRRERPARGQRADMGVAMPSSHAFPSGHTASAFAFSSAVGGLLPGIATPLRVMATTVAYSRVHTGVHYVGDVLVGGLVGAGVGTAVRQVAVRLSRRSSAAR
jgi:undecaprenyl-diphosphatase